MRAPNHVDAVIIGAGFSGLYMLKRLRDQGLSAVVLERGDGVGGTWYWNRYPGAKCDVESPYYSFSFDPELDQEWEWTERYPAQHELMAYMNHVTDRYDLRKDIRFETTVASAVYDESDNLWQITSVGPEGGQLTKARYCIMATGCLSVPNVPDLEGLDDFNGAVYHTGNWPHEGVDFTGMRVGVIGTGSSGVQAIPEIAKQAKDLKVFQRSPNFCVPAKNGPLDAQFVAEVKANYPEIRETARLTPTGLPFFPSSESGAEADEARAKEVFDEHWTLGSFRIGQSFSDIGVSQEANDKLSGYVHDKIDEIVTDQEVAEKLKPRDHPITTKRICVDTDYYETFNRPHVELVDVRTSPITRITESGVKTQVADYELDALVLATGYDAMTGAIMKIDIRGRDGAELREHWNAGPRTYLGLSVAGFPNLFSLAGPGSPSVLTNMVSAIEQHVEWVDDHIAYLQRNGLQTSEALPDAEEDWIKHVNEVADMTLFKKANSWYLGANIPGKPRVFMAYAGGLGAYRQQCDTVAAGDYEGFQMA
ncbi:flavin-containing monooxygenase [Microbacterium sp. A93]|uniref:flavin-containing monooxygenase n=1 Tax=Microbacterium sp. A93 TaxID=3450716 RepID=UPI003F43EC42